MLSFCIRPVVMIFACVYLANTAAQKPTTKSLVTTYEKSMIKKPPASLGLDTFYKKYTDANGIPIVSSAKVPNAALLVARDIVNYMLMKRPDVREEMMKRKSRVSIMAE